MFVMKNKIEEILKYFPAITAVCYICGFIIFKSFLLKNGIVETDILNVRFIEAGIFYLVIAPFILATPFITNRNPGYLGSIFTALFAFIIYNSLIGPQDLNFLWKAYLIVILYNSFAYLIWHKYSLEKQRKVFDLTESPLFFFAIIISSLAIFSIYYKDIKSNFGGGQNYKKVLILKERQYNLIKTDTLMRTDTLIIIYENKDFIYYKEKENTKSIRKDIVIGEIFIK